MPPNHLSLVTPPRTRWINAHVGELGSWTSTASSQCNLVEVSPADPNACVPTTAAVELPPNSWVVVTASNPCGEGPFGSDSLGTERGDAGAWPSCLEGDR